MIRMIKWSINKKLICFLWLISGLTLCGCATSYYISKDINPSMFANREEKLRLPLKAGLYLSDETRNYPVYARLKLSKIVIGEALEKTAPISLEKAFNEVSIFYNRNNVPQNIDRIIVIDFSGETESKNDFEPKNYDAISCKTELLYKIYDKSWNLLQEGKAKGYDIQRIPKLKSSGVGGAYGATVAAYHGFQEWKTTTRMSLIEALEQINDQILTSPEPEPTPKPSEGIEMVYVKGGCYQMGDTFGDGYSEEKPVHEVCVDDFNIGKYEVTQGQWKAVMGNNPSSKSRGASFPVENVSWNDIQDFINKLNQKTKNNPQAPFGKGEFRLPTEAEWEYAARSGGKSEKYSGGNDIDSVAWYDNNSGGKTHPVGTKQPNGLGIYDMSGNVWEWCNDWYDGNYYKNSPKDNPKGPNSGSYRVLRGGCWVINSRLARTALRYWYYPDGGGRGGFRLVRTQ